MAAQTDEHRPGSRVTDDGRVRRRILDNLTTAILTLDQALNLISLNASGENLLAVSEKQAMGQSVTALFPRDPAFGTTLRRCLEDSRLYTAHEQELHLTDGKTVTVDFTVTTVIDRGQKLLLIEMIQVDRLLRLAREDALARQHSANRNVIKGLAHEIKNPLGGIRGAAQLLERELPQAGLREYTQIIIQEVDRLRGLVDHMLGPNRPPRHALLNIHEVLERVRRLELAETQQGVQFICDFDPSLPDLHGDPDQLLQAFLNVVRNAIQAMGGQGTVIMRTRAERQFTIGQQRHRLMIRVDIEDNGPGIDESVIENIFYPLVTSRADGAGIGLSISQDIVAKHGGLIECSSRPKKTVFTFYLPLEQNK